MNGKSKHTTYTRRFKTRTWWHHVPVEEVEESGYDDVDDDGDYTSHLVEYALVDDVIKL